MRITAHDINFTIDSRTIFDGVSLDVPSGTAMALTGPSGSGKTTLLNCLSLLLPVSRGEILIDGTDVTRLSEGRRRRFWRDSVAFVFQDYGLVPDESVGFNVCMESSPLFRKPKKWGAGVEDALNRVGLTGRASERRGTATGRYCARDPQEGQGHLRRRTHRLTGRGQPADRPRPAAGREGPRGDHRHLHPRRPPFVRLRCGVPPGLLRARAGSPAETRFVCAAERINGTSAGGQAPRSVRNRGPLPGPPALRSSACTTALVNDV